MNLYIGVIICVTCPMGSGARTGMT